METSTGARMANLTVAVEPRDLKRILSDRIWYCHSDRFAEIESVKDNIRILFFNFLHPVGESRTETQVVGYFLSPKCSGTAVRDNIDKCFILSEGGDYQSLSVAEGFAVEFPLYVRLPWLPSKTGHRIWQISDDDCLAILRQAYDVHISSEENEASEVISALELVIDEVETFTRKTQVSPWVQTELGQLPEWLREEIDSCDVAGLPATAQVISSLLGRARENNLYNLQAAVLQLKLGDYKFLLSLASFCYSKGFILLRQGDHSGAQRYFFQAAQMYQSDPMITEKDWKRQKILECLTRSIDACVKCLLEENQYSLDYEGVESLALRRFPEIRRFLKKEEVQRRIRVTFYVNQGKHFRDGGQRDAFVQLLSGCVDTDFGNDLPRWLVATYYDLQAARFSKKTPRSRSDLEQALKYKSRAVEAVRQTFDSSQSERDRVMLIEEEIDYYKLSALLASRCHDRKEFIQSVDTAISKARQLQEYRPSEYHESNVDYFTGLKFQVLAQWAEEPGDKADHHAAARDAFSKLDTIGGRKSFLFHQVWYYFFRLCQCMGTTESEFEAAALCSKEALQSDWARLGEQCWPSPLIEEHKALHLSIVTFGAEASADDLDRLAQEIRAMEAKGAQNSIRNIARLVYGLQLIRLSGLDELGIINEMVIAIRSAIRQLLKGGSISPDVIIDDLQIEKERSDQDEEEIEILSKLRRRKSGEDFTLEVKRSAYDPRGKGFLSTIHETAIAFLNSPVGGQLFIGIEDSDFSVVGIAPDLAKVDGSKDKLKLAIDKHIQDKLIPGLSCHLPKISISFPEVRGHTLLRIQVPPGPYDRGLYVDNEGVAYLRKDGRLERISDVMDRDEYASQRRERRGLWAPQ